MRVFNKDKTEVLESYDLEKGYLTDDVFVTHVPASHAVEEVGHYKTLKVYDNGGIDVEYVVDTPARPEVVEHDETEEIKVYIPYTDAELRKIAAEARIEELKRLLRASDYKAIKYAEGVLAAEEYAPVKAERQAYRNEINDLEKILQT